MSVALGIWLMAAPSLLDYGGRARLNDVIVGPLVASLATIAIWEITRSLRWLNLLLGLWLLAAPWILGYHQAHPIVNDMLVGLVVAGTSLIRGEIRKKFGGGWAVLWR